ncbi:GAF domain-containing protein [Sphingomonas sp. CFBP 8760]|nr:GAF domain-containing protein [Sphingomonas sp. CFBP 8760]
MFKNLFRERRRSDVVHGLSSHDASAEPVFTRFADDAALAFNAPIAALTLIHDDLQSIMASHGFPIGCMVRSNSFCTYAIDHPGVLECCDPDVDARFAHLPSVTGDPGVRYYIGAPLRLLSGIDVGTLCVIDTVRRLPASADQTAYLLGLARQASMALDARLDIWGHAA